jgi:Leucine-rich repeat (LRR) protein
MPLQVLSLSVNGISSLRDFMHCRELRELYLRKNNVANLSDIRSAAAGHSTGSMSCSTSLQHS